MPEDFAPQTLDATVLSDEAQAMQRFLLSTIIGQDKAVNQFVKVYQQISIGMNKENRPAGVFLFTGPTGVGKTELVRRAAEFVLNKRDGITRIDCGEFQASHEISKLIGAPPGYVGYNDKTAVRLSQESIDKHQTTTQKINFLLFDEIEEAHENLLSAILQILDAGKLTLGNGEVTNFTNTIVILTSNLGEKEMQLAISGAGLGLKPHASADTSTVDEKVYKVSKKAATRYFKAKFMNRIDRLIVFRSLAEDSLKKILKIEMMAVQSRLWKSAVTKWEREGAKTSFPVFRPIIKTTDAANAFLIKEGTSAIYGARELNRALDRFVSFPLGSLVGSKQIEPNDIIQVDHKDGDKKLTFTRVGKRDIKPVVPTYINQVPADFVPDSPDSPDVMRPKPKKPEPPRDTPRLPYWTPGSGGGF